MDQHSDDKLLKIAGLFGNRQKLQQGFKVAAVLRRKMNSQNKYGRHKNGQYKRDNQEGCEHSPV